MPAPSLPPFLKALAPDDVRRALAGMTLMSAPAGTTLIEEGDADPTLIVVITGGLQVRTGDLVLAEVGPGGVVGEMALFGEGLRLASVSTTGETGFLLVTRDAYVRLRDGNNPVAWALERQALADLVDRLRVVNARIAALAEGTDAAAVAPSPSFLQRIARLLGVGSEPDTQSVEALGALRATPVFRDATDRGLKKVAAWMQVRGVPTGTFLCTQGEAGDEMFVVVEGRVEVFADTRGDKVEPLATLEPGDVFGMGSMLDAVPRMASCVANGSVVVLALDRGGWDELVGAPDEGGSAFRVALIRALTANLAVANAQLTAYELRRRAADSGVHRLHALNLSVDTYTHEQALQGA
jgi:CRP-like cAMP-binding protein